MKRPFLFFSIAVTLFSCKVDDGLEEAVAAGKEIDLYVEYKVENSISSDINFMPLEVYEDQRTIQAPDLKLYLFSKEDYPCVNYEIATTIFNLENELIIRFDSIPEPVGCFRGIGPATSYISLPEGINKLTLINGDTVDRYTITIDSQKVVLSSLEDNFTTSLYERTLRYVKNTFAYICGTDQNKGHLYEDFRKKLLNVKSIKSFVYEGEGRNPYPDSSNGHHIDFPVSYFQYKDSSDIKLAGELMQEFTADSIPPDPNFPTTIILISWDNRVYRSWVK